MQAAAQREYEFTRGDFDFLRKLSNSHTGIVVTDDKFDMFYSRLSRRVRALGLPSFAAYCRYLEEPGHDAEMVELINAVTTNLTAFFRENHHFEYLTNTAIPEVIRRNGRDRTLSIWSAGCSTGEEPYSLAMTLGEHAGLRGWQSKITATDIDSNVLAKASAGVYEADRVNGISPARLKRWFQRGKGSNQGRVRLKEEARRLIEFSQLNLMHNWQMPPQDIIFCRNVIIYFNKETKAELIAKYARVLKPGGLLFIGHSESLFKVSDAFELIGNTIYRKLG